MPFTRKTTITPRHYIKDRKAKISDVYCQIRLRDKAPKIYYKMKVPTILWDFSMQVAKTKSKYKSKSDKELFSKMTKMNSNWEKSNKKLNSMIQKVEDIVTDYSNSVPYYEHNVAELKTIIEEKLFGSQLVKNDISSKTCNRTHSICDFLSELIQRMKDNTITKENGGNYNKDTIVNYNALQVALKLYENNLVKERNDESKEQFICIRFDDIDYQFSHRFKKFMYDCKDLDVNKLSTVGRYLKDLKSAMRIAAREKVSNNKEDYKLIKVPSSKVTRVALDKNEIKLITNIELSGEVEVHRDLFILCYHLGFRVSDLKTIKSHHVRKKYISKVLLKGLTPYKHKINKKARRILEKYDYNIPKLIEGVYRRNIKKIVRLAGINHIIEYKEDYKGEFIPMTKEKWKMVSSHTARRSSIKNKALKGWTEHELMAFSGHKKSETLKAYLDVVF